MYMGVSELGGKGEFFEVRVWEMRFGLCEYFSCTEGQGRKEGIYNCGFMREARSFGFKNAHSDHKYTRAKCLLATFQALGVSKGVPESLLLKNEFSKCALNNIFILKHNVEYL